MGGLAGADGINFAALDQFDLDLGYLAEAQDRVIRPARAGDAFAIEAYALLQYPTCRLDRATLDLVDHAVGINGLANVDGERQLPHPDIFVALDFGNGGAIGTSIFV